MEIRLTKKAKYGSQKHTGMKNLYAAFVFCHVIFGTRRSLLYAPLLILFSSFLLSACGTRVPLHRQLAPLPSGPICRVAVLPFINDSDYPFGDTIINKVFATQFHEAGNYLVIQEGDILKVYQQLHILPGMEPSLEQFQIIADRVNVQLLITGIIMEMREDRGEHGANIPLIILEMQIRDGTNGEVLWTTYHRRQGTDYKKTMHFGTIQTVTGLSRQMAEEIINLWLNRGLKQCNVLPQS